MKKAVILFLLLALVITRSNAQEYLYFLDLKLVNPALLRSDDSFGFNGSYQSAFSDIDGEPIKWHGGIEFGEPGINSGFGAHLQRNAIGSFENDAFKLSYAYFHTIDKEATVSFGAALSINQLVFDITALDIGGDPILNPITRDSNLDIDLGASYQRGKLTFGFSVQNILESEYEDFSSEFSSIYNPRTMTFFANYGKELSANYAYETNILFVHNEIGDVLDISLINRLFNYGLIAISYNRQFINESSYRLSFSLGCNVSDDFILMAKVYQTDNIENDFYDPPYEFGVRFNLKK